MPFMPRGEGDQRADGLRRSVPPRHRNMRPTEQPAGPAGRRP
ncbi:hypothetical protein ACRAWD_22710 [Caulobacter segnis]